ncbi:MAG: hypothetical protein QXH87_01920 [Candidatus Bathyarchaeia archaeon]
MSELVKVAKNMAINDLGFLGFLLLLSGISSGNILMVVIGVALAFAGASGHLISCFESESRVKKALEVFFSITAITIIVIGYIITGNPILGFLTCFIGIMLFAAFTLSYLLPKLRG